MAWILPDEGMLGHVGFAKQPERHLIALPAALQLLLDGAQWGLDAT